MSQDPSQSPAAQPQPPVIPEPVIPAELSTQLAALGAPTAEAGSTTTEWKLAVGAVGSTGVGLVVTVITNHVHVLTASDVDAIKAFLFALDGVVVAYVLGRSVRKLGTTA